MFYTVSLLGAKQARSFYFLCAPWPPLVLRAPIARRLQPMISYEPEPTPASDAPDDLPDPTDVAAAADAILEDAFSA